MPRTPTPFTSLVLSVLLLGAGLAPAGAEAAPRRPIYVDAASYLQDEADFEAWFTLRRRLRLNFDAICGDTFCEGDYTNIQALRYVCSVQRLTGRVGQCAWSFAASEETVDPAHGRIGLDAPAWLCRSPLAPGTTIEALLDALQGEEPLYAPLPGTALTLYDGLVDCL